MRCPFVQNPVGGSGIAQLSAMSIIRPKINHVSRSVIYNNHTRDNQKMTPDRITKIRKQRRADIVASLKTDVRRLTEAVRMDFALLIGSYYAGTFDSTSDVDVVCVVKDKKESSLSSVDFPVSAQKDVDIILVNRANWASADSWVKEGVELKQTYAKEGRELGRRAGRYAHAKQFKRMRKVLKRHLS